MQVDRRKRCFSAQRFIKKSEATGQDHYSDEAISRLVRLAYDPARIPRRIAGDKARTHDRTYSGRILLRSKKAAARTHSAPREGAEIILFPVRPRLR
ncbi:MAG: hypothetical protein WCZ87_01615 [Thiohalobacteraceae bacterium]